MQVDLIMYDYISNLRRSLKILFKTVYNNTYQTYIGSGWLSPFQTVGSLLLPDFWW